jgi:outer membrane receptor protein involved in Fe transport
MSQILCARRALLLTASLAGVMLPVSAQQARAQTSAAPVEFVTVTATRGASQQNLDVSSTILSASQVLEAPQIGIDQIVNKIPGVYTTQQPGGQLHPTGQPFSIRGFGTSTNINTLLLVDGIPANDPYFRTVDFSQVPKQSVQSIEVIRGGGASSAWGNMAMGGIVNVVTRQPSQGLSADVSGGSFGMFDGELAGGLQLSSDLVIGANLGITKTNGYNATPRQFRNPYMVAAASENQNYRVSAVFTPDAATDLYLSLTHHRITEDGLTWVIARNFWQTDRIALGSSRALSDKDSVNFSAWYGQGSMFTQNASNSAYSIFKPTQGTPFVSQREKVTYHHVGGALFYKADWGSFRDINIGADGREIWAHDPLNVFSTTDQIGLIVADAKHQFEGLYAQGTWQADSIPLQVTVGVREDFWQAVDAGVTGYYRGSPIATVVPDQTYDHFSPRIGVKYRLPFGLDVRAAAYSDFAAPGMNQMYRSFIAGPNFATSNADLKPQTNFGREVGLDMNGDNYHFSFTLYDNSLTRFIDFATVQSGCAAANNYCGTGIVAIAGGALRQYVNAGSATLKGMELLGDWQILDTLSINGGVVMTDAYLTSSNYTTVSAGVIPDPLHQQLGQVPRWTITGGLSWQPIPDLLLNLTAKSFPGFWNNTSHTQFNSAATLFDVSASYRLNQQVGIYVAAQNILNKTYYASGLGYTATNGSTVSGSTVPALGIPFNVTAGIRYSL